MLMELPQEYILASDEGITRRVTGLAEYESAARVFAYYSIGREVNTHNIISDALDKGKTVALPVVLGGGAMEYAVIESLEDEFMNGQLSIPEPREGAARISPQAGDFLLVPALRFDKHGFRLGQGGGYYDRLLAGCRAFSAGLCRERMLMADMPLEPHDMAVNCLVTENRVTRLR